MTHTDRDRVLDELEAAVEKSANCPPFLDMSERYGRMLSALRSLRAEVAELRKRDPERKCGMCGHKWQDHEWHRALGCCVASASDSYCECLGFTEPAAGREAK